MQCESIEIMFSEIYIDIYTNSKTKEMIVTNYLGVGEKGCEQEGTHLGATRSLAMLFCDLNADLQILAL